MYELAKSKMDEDWVIGSEFVQFVSRVERICSIEFWYNVDLFQKMDFPCWLC